MDVSHRWCLEPLGYLTGFDGLIYDLGYLSEGLHTIRLLVTDSDGLEASETVAITVDPENQSPSCSIINPLDPTEADNTELIIFQGQVSDPDTNPNTLDIEWKSNLDGVLGHMPADSSGLSQLPISGLSIGAHIISLTVTDDKEANCVDQIILNIVSGNGTPSAPVIEINPETPIAEFDDLTCQITQAAIDPEGDIVSYEFSWQKNGSPWTGQTDSQNNIGDTIPFTETLSGEQWDCIVIATDGVNVSQPAQATATTQSCAESERPHHPTIMVL